ncbi:MAG: glycosyl hydrolase [Thermoguttaceae bacterium]
MTRFLPAAIVVGLLAAGAARPAEHQDPPPIDQLARSFAAPSQASQAWCYWWWLNGCVTREGIVRDLDHMKAMGIGGALVFHAGNGQTPFKTEFMSPEWRDLFKLAVAEAAKRRIVVGANLCGGWNAGGPWVEADHAAQTLAFRCVNVDASQPPGLALPPPLTPETEYYRDIAVLAWKCVQPPVGSPLVCLRETMIDLTPFATGNRLDWRPPDGSWMVVRFGHYVDPRAHTKCTGGGRWLEIDPLRADAMDRHFAATAGVLIGDVGEHAGKTLQYLHIDSGEIGKPDWTPAFREEFTRRRGYDPFPCLAARAGITVDTPEVTRRFNEDYERTLGDLMVDNYYGRLAELARRHGLGTHCEAAGFQKPCVDALQALAANDICMSEFWVRRSTPGDSYIHQLAEQQLRNHDGVRTAAAAAHTYGRKIVMAEAYTVMNRPPGFPNYDKDPWSLKDTGDRAFCAGMNRTMLCFMVHQPDETSLPGYEWPQVGTEFNRHVTWWTMGQPWLTYLARCQSLLQAGDFAADVAWFPGEWVPDYVPARWARKPALPEGYDCDTLNANVLCRAANVSPDGRLQLESGMSYRYLVLDRAGRWTQLPPEEMFPSTHGSPSANHPDPTAVQPHTPEPLALSPPTLDRIRSLVEQGMTLVGPPQLRAVGLSNYPEGDAQVNRLADALWGASPGPAGQRRVGRGRVLWGKSLDEVFAADRLLPDLQIHETAGPDSGSPQTLNGIPNPAGSFDWIHRRIGGADVYFIANLRSVEAQARFTFRVARRTPELWDAVTGLIRPLSDCTTTGDHRTEIAMKFAPRQSFFVVFARDKDDATREGARKGNNENFPHARRLMELTGPWDLQFDLRWFYPDDGTRGNVRLDQLTDWTQCPQDPIRHYSGTATYRKTFDLPDTPVPLGLSPLYLDLGVVKNLARVRLNGHDLGVVWTAPWRVEIGKVVTKKQNSLEIEVVNLWPNRLIGDAGLPPQERLTRTNIPGIRPTMPLLPSGLLGPATITQEEDPR